MTENDGSPQLSDNSTVNDTTEQVFINVETMPHYKECITDNKDEQNSCTHQKIVQYVADNFIVPEGDSKKEIHGRIIASFVVNKKGKIEDVTIMRGLNETIDNEAIRVIQSIPEMIPGEQFGKYVKVRYVIPITVSQNSKKEKKKKKKKKS